MFSEGELSEADELYKRLISASHRNVLRSTYIALLKQIESVLVQLRSGSVVKLSTVAQGAITTVPDRSPDFSSLIQDVQMKAILERRWVECTACIAAEAPLAATVMMGGLLEGLLLARVNSQSNKTHIFTASAAPRDRQGKSLQLKDWTLQNYIAVAHELNWISQTVKDIGEVLRDYRNYIHPQKEFSEKVSLSTSDATLLWEISRSIARQVLAASP